MGGLLVFWLDWILWPFFRRGLEGSLVLGYVGT